MNPTNGLDGAMSDVLSGKAHEYARKVAARGGDDQQIASALEYAGRKDALHGGVPDEPSPAKAAMRCEPVHVLMCYMKAEGLSNKEIAKRTNYSVIHVSNICRQSWFRERFLQITREAGIDDVTAFLQGEVMNCVETLVELRETGTKYDAVRLAAVNATLDRALGKPTVTVKSETSLNLSSATSSKEDLERQLAATYAEQQSRGLRPSLPPDTRN